MNWRLQLLFIAVFLVSCNDTLRTKRSPAQNLGRIMAAPVELSQAQQNIAYDICLALRSKNTLFRAEMGGHKFIFDLEHNNCAGQKYTSNVQATLKVPASTTSPMEWQAQSSMFFKYEETHEHGLLSVLCTQILKGETPSNTYEGQNGQLLQVSFANSSVGIQAFTVATGVVDGDGDHMVVKYDNLKVVTGVQPNNTYVGLIKHRTQTIPCSNGKSETLTQIYYHD